MSGKRSFNLFSLGRSMEGTPSPLVPTTFQEWRASELQDLERWLKAQPDVLGESLKIVSAQLTGFDKTLDRLDLLALDRNARLVVIEIKRDEKSKAQDLQALRYAAYCSSLTVQQVVDEYRKYELAENDRVLTEASAQAELEAFVDLDSLDGIEETDTPRMILVATGFPVGVTNTALWLRRNTELDISCVQLQPYEINGELVLAASVLIPLPEAEEFQTRLRAKERKARDRRVGDKIDFTIAREFIAAIPAGRWSSYGDVAAASGAPRGGQALGTWLLRLDGDAPPNVHRVLKRHGTVSPGWTADPAGGLPETPEGVRVKLIDEGVPFDGERASQSARWTAEDWVGPSGISG